MRFLSLATYRCDTPRHGGQVRLAALHRQLRAAGWETRQFAVCADGDADGPDAVQMNPDFIAAIRARGGRTDVSAADFLLSDRERWLDRLFDAIEGLRPDVIAVEQAWLWPALQEYFRTYGNRDSFAVIHSAHNIESVLLASEAALDGFTAAAPDEIAKARVVERGLAREADGIVAVSREDAAYFRTLNPRVLVAPNGASPPSQSGGTDAWSKRLGGCRFALFVGSAHPPNVAGFAACLLRPNLGWLGPDRRIVVAGSVGSALQAMPAFRAYHDVNRAHCEFVGIPEEAELAALYHLAHAIALPITAGGGTNIKTAEALRSLHHVVVTRAALRGYDAFRGLPGLRLVEQPEQFPAALLAAFDAAAAPLVDPEWAARLDDLLWDRTLAAYPGFLARLAETRALALAPGRYEPRCGLEALLGGGWYHGEPGGVWSRGTRAMLRVATDRPAAETFTLTLAVSGFPPPDRVQTLAVTCRGAVLASTTFRDPGAVQELHLRLAADDLPGQAATELEVIASSAATPYEVCGSPDRRMLGVRLHWAHLEYG